MQFCEVVRDARDATGLWPHGNRPQPSVNPERSDRDGSVIPAAGLTGARATTAEAAPRVTDRELQVLRGVARGQTNRQVARELGIGEATVKTHLVHVFQKLGVGSRTEAVAEARRRRIIRG